MRKENGTSLQDRVTEIGKRLNEWIWSPEIRLTSTSAKISHRLLRIFLIIFLECRRDRLTLRASALTFTVVLSLVPTLALGTAVLKGLGAGDQMKQAAYRFINQLEETGNAFSMNGDSTNTEKSSGEEHSQSITGHLQRAVDTLFEYVEKTDFATLGAFGIIGVVLAVLSVLGNIERSMNAIWQAASDRPLGRKMIDYLALMILLPLSVNLTLATEATIQSPTLFSKVQTVIPLAWLQNLLINFMPIAVVIATFTVMYRFLPNTKVRILPALIGGVFGGIGWLLLQGVYISMQLGVARYNAIYGSFATLPLFLFWIYMGWLVFLAGAEVAFACQNWRGYMVKQVNLTASEQLTIAFKTMTSIVAAFMQRTTISRRDLSDQLGVPESYLQQILTPLEKAELIRKECDTDGYLPAAPINAIHPTEIMTILWGTPSDAHPLAVEAMQAAQNALCNKTLFDKTGDDGPVQTDLFYQNQSPDHQPASSVSELHKGEQNNGNTSS